MQRHRQQPHRIFFETLGNHTRWEIVRLLKRREMRATAIAERLGCEQSLVSHHLRRLERCGFLRCSPNGRERVYALNRESVMPLLTLVERHIEKFCQRVCCPTPHPTRRAV